MESGMDGSNFYLVNQNPSELQNTLQLQGEFYQQNYPDNIQTGYDFSPLYDDDSNGLSGFISSVSLQSNGSASITRTIDSSDSNLPLSHVSSAWSQQPSTQAPSYQNQPPPRISRGAFKRDFRTLSSLLPHIFALTSTFAFFMPSVNIFQDIDDDDDAAQDDAPGGIITSLMGAGRLALRLVFAAYDESQQNIDTQYTMGNVATHYMSQILKWFLTDFYRFQRSVRRAARELVCIGYGFSAMASVSDNKNRYQHVVHEERYLHFFSGKGPALLPFGSSVVLTAYYQRFYFDKDALARQMAAALIKLPMLQAMCQNMLGIDVSWRSGGSLNAYLLPVIATRHDIHEWGEGENHKTIWNLSDADRHNCYKNTFLNNAHLLELAKKIFVVIASGWFNKTRPHIAPPDESDNEPEPDNGRVSPQPAANFGLRST